jgi:hypothetical protein
MHEPPLALHNLPHWHSGLDCTRTALCAVTGLEPAAVEGALVNAAAMKDETITSDSSTSQRHWGPALKTLGYSWEVQRERDKHPQITIDAFMAMPRNPADVLLVLAYDDTKKYGHVFAAQGNNLVDTYTRGEVRLSQRRMSFDVSS